MYGKNMGIAGKEEGSPAFHTHIRVRSQNNNLLRMRSATSRDHYSHKYWPTNSYNYFCPMKHIQIPIT